MVQIFILGLKYNINKNSRRNIDSEKSKPQMGFEPTTLRDLVGCSNHWATGDSCGEQGSNCGFKSHLGLGFFRVYVSPRILVDVGLKCFELVSILFAIVPDYGNDTQQKKIKIEPVSKILLNLNHNIYVDCKIEMSQLYVNEKLCFLFGCVGQHLHLTFSVLTTIILIFCVLYYTWSIFFLR